MKRRRAILGGIFSALAIDTCKAQSGTATSRAAIPQALPEPLVWPIATKLQPGIRSFVGHVNTALDVIGQIGTPPSLVIFTEGNCRAAILSGHFQPGPSLGRHTPIST